MSSAQDYRAVVRATVSAVEIRSATTFTWFGCPSPDVAPAVKQAVSPATASEPIAYSWSPEPATGQSTAIVEYVWSITGPYTISVIVRNIDGIATDTHVINLGQYMAFLPTVVRD